jgi:hypothetical protein
LYVWDINGGLLASVDTCAEHPDDQKDDFLESEVTDATDWITAVAFCHGADLHNTLVITGHHSGDLRFWELTLPFQRRAESDKVDLKDLDIDLDGKSVADVQFHLGYAEHLRTRATAKPPRLTLRHRISARCAMGSPHNSAIRRIHTSRWDLTRFWTGDHLGIVAQWTTKVRDDHWVPDKVFTSCKNCSTRFSMFERRHHCRKCGLVFDLKCSNQFRKIPEYGYYTPQRVCLNCMVLLDREALRERDDVDDR